MLKVKNNKSDKELAVHDTLANGEIIFNAGAETGPKKSEYKFNTVNMPIPGTNFQVEINPGQEHEYNVADNSVQKMQLEKSAVMSGASLGGEQPGPVDRNVTFEITEDETGWHTTCNKTYAELKALGTDFIPTVLFDSEEVASSATLPDGEFVFGLKMAQTEVPPVYYPIELNGEETVYLKSDQDIRVYFAVDETFGTYREWYVICMRPDGSFVYDAGGRQNADANNYYYSVSYKNGNTVIAPQLTEAETPTDIMVGLDYSYINYIKGLLNAKGFTKQNINPTDGELAIELNFINILFPAYKILGYGEVVGTLLVDKDDNTKYHFYLTNMEKDTFGLLGTYKINDDGEFGFELVDYDIIFELNGKELTFVRIDSHLDEYYDASIQEYDFYFNAEITFTYSEQELPHNTHLSPSVDSVTVTNSAGENVNPPYENGAFNSNNFGKLVNVTVNTPDGYDKEVVIPISSKGNVSDGDLMYMPAYTVPTIYTYSEEDQDEKWYFGIMCTSENPTEWTAYIEKQTE